MSRLLIALALLTLLPINAWAVQPCHTQSFEGDSFTICAFAPKSDALVIATTDSTGIPLRSFDALASQLGPTASRVRFAMNAGMFDDAGNAIGLLVEAGHERHKLNRAKGGGNFHMMPNGVFSQDADGTLRVETTSHFALRRSTPHGAAPRWATQSGPMLVIQGKLHPQIAADGPSRYLRNGVGATDKGSAYFVISDAPVSFGKFARLFRDELHCRNALYFDGSVSSLWEPSSGRKDSARLLGPMIAVLSP
jgi:uncharacterized protein YigE (DUF2233 family)